MKYLNQNVQWTWWPVLGQKVGTGRGPYLGHHSWGTGSLSESPSCWGPGQSPGQDLATAQGQRLWLPGSFPPRKGERRQLCRQKQLLLVCLLGVTPGLGTAWFVRNSAQRARRHPPASLLSCPGWKPFGRHPARHLQALWSETVPRGGMSSGGRDWL